MAVLDKLIFAALVCIAPIVPADCIPFAFDVIIEPLLTNVNEFVALEVAVFESCKDVLESISTKYVFAGMPVPVTNIPRTRPDVDPAVVTEQLPFVVVKLIEVDVFPASWNTV